ncbi:aspartate aminotransferase family protein [Paenibacillus hodogayensis]|uniref:Aspartate aminotransferase family protein n=1 Tax=Paenibacillus hodogayensis TaxID=279208 RepID=A0ABV5VR04_9BACL
MLNKHEDDTATRKLLEEAGRSILFTAKRPPVVMERGEGMYVWDTEGNRYLDFIGGWAVTCLGHSPMVIREALDRQASTLVNASPAFYNRPMIEFAKLLTGLSGYDKAFFASSGAEANEGAIKLARKHGALRLGGASDIVTTTGSFHGRTLATMSATGKAQWKHLFAPAVPGFKHVPLNDADAMLAAVDGNTCAIMLELVQGEGGAHPADAGYVRRLRELCDERGMMLIFDEIQTGLGRTGKLFAAEHYDVQADATTLGKGIGGGFPLSALLTRDRFDIFEPGDQGGTYIGQPLAMAVGLAVVTEIVDRGLPRRAERMGEYIRDSLSSVSGRYGLGPVRGKGLLLAFDLPEPRGAELVAECLREGLLINSPQPSAIRLIPPLIVEEEHVDGMVAALCRTMDRLFA